MDFDELEKIRQTYARKLRKGWGISGGVILAILLFCVIYLVATAISMGDQPKITMSNGIWVILPILMPGLVLAIFILVIAAIIISLTTRKDAELYRRAYKAYFVERNLKNIFANVQYGHDTGISANVLRSTGMMRIGDIYRSNDLTLGKYKNVQFAQADVIMQDKHEDSDGNTTYITIFKGRWLMFEFPKKFSFRLEVVTRGFRAGLVPKSTRTGKKFQQINTESTDFNKKFYIYGEDGVEAFYLLDPAFIEKIDKIATAYGKPFILCFIENKLHIGLNDGNDSFEPPSPYKTINKAAEDARVAQDIKVITDFVDVLSLDRKLFEE